jgi:hypothetical protein
VTEVACGPQRAALVVPILLFVKHRLLTTKPRTSASKHGDRCDVTRECDTAERGDNPAGDCRCFGKTVPWSKK